MNEKKRRPIKKRPAHRGQTFDVMRPGRAPADATSRPAIVGHKPIVQDPMMTDTSHRPLMGHHKETIPALEPAPAAESVPTPTPMPETPEVHAPAAIPTPLAQTTIAPAAVPGPPPVAAGSTPTAPASSGLHMQGDAEDIAPVLTGRHASTGSPATEASAPSPAQTAIPTPDRSKMVDATTGTSPTLSIDEIKAQLAVPTDTAAAPAGAPSTPSVSGQPTAQSSALQPPTAPDLPKSDAQQPVSQPSMVPPPTPGNTPPAPIKTPDPGKPAPVKPNGPSVAEQIAPRSTKPIKPLPKEAFDALKADDKKPAPHPNTTVTDAGVVISHHRSAAASKHTSTWILATLLAVAAALTAWYFLG